MKEQYVGDINDYRKYALLRVLACAGQVKIGVCWMLTPPDGKTDGRKNEYLYQPDRWRQYDPTLFDLLKSVVDSKDSERLPRIERSGIIPSAEYFNEILPDSKSERQEFFATATKRFQTADLIFFDPDNGLDVSSKPKGRKYSSKYIYRDEINSVYSSGHSVLLYQHFAREERERFVERVATDISSLAKDAAVWSYRTSNVVFFLLVNPRHVPVLGRCARDTAPRWDVHFLVGKELRIFHAD